MRQHLGVFLFTLSLLAGAAMSATASSDRAQPASADVRNLQHRAIEASPTARRRLDAPTASPSTSPTSSSSPAPTASPSASPSPSPSPAPPPLSPQPASLTFTAVQQIQNISVGLPAGVTQINAVSSNPNVASVGAGIPLGTTSVTFAVTSVSTGSATITFVGSPVQGVSGSAMVTVQAGTATSPPAVQLVQAAGQQTLAIVAAVGGSTGLATLINAWRGPTPAPTAATAASSAPKAFLTPLGTEAHPLQISRRLPSVVAVNGRVQDIKPPVSGDATCVTATVAASGADGIVMIRAADNARANCTTTVTVALADGTAGIEYIAVP